MIRPHEKNHVLISGIFISALLIVFMITVIVLNKESAFLSSKKYLSIEVKNAQNLKIGAAIQLKGIKIGSVTDISFQSLDGILITLGIQAQYLQWIKNDSYVSFKTQGVLGDKLLEILGGTENAPTVIDGAKLTVNEISSIDQIITKSEDIIIIAGRVLGKLDKILSNVDDKRIDRILYNLEMTSQSSQKFVSSLSSAKIPEMTGKLTSATSELEQILSQIAKGPGTLHSLIYDPAIHEDLKSLLGGANRNKVLKYFIRESVKNGEAK